MSKIELIVLHSNTSKHLPVCKLMNRIISIK